MNKVYQSILTYFNCDLFLNDNSIIIMPPIQKILKPENKIIIFVDNREFNSKVVKELARLDCIVKPKQLEVGDYILSDRVCIERKSSKGMRRSQKEALLHL